MGFAFGKAALPASCLLPFRERSLAAGLELWAGGFSGLRNYHGFKIILGFKAIRDASPGGRHTSSWEWCLLAGGSL